jgi:regulator of ribonuclease activity A
MSSFKTADLCDEFADELEVCLAQFRTFGGRRSFSGEIQTVSTFEDVGLVRQCLGQPGRGRVLVVDGGGSTRVTLLGDRLSAKAIENGWFGVLIFGAVRDTEALATMDLGVMALGVVPARGSFNGTGSIGTSFQAGGVEFAPGRFAYCDTDGVVVSSRMLHNLREFPTTGSATLPCVEACLKPLKGSQLARDGAGCDRGSAGKPNLPRA